MSSLSTTAAWNETAEILKRDFGAFFTIAIAFNALPSVAMQVFSARLNPTELPDAALLLLIFPVVLLLAIVGTLAVTALALGRENVVGRAIRHGFRRCLPMFGASALIFLPAALIAASTLGAVGLRPDAAAGAAPAPNGPAALAMLALLIVFLLVWVRLIMMTPVAAAEEQGPLGIIRRSWELTRGRFWPLLGFVLLLLLAFIVLTIAVAAVFGILVTLAAGPPRPGTLAAFLLALVNGLVNAAVIVVFTTMVARLYVQIAGAGAGEGGA
ncbi:MAG TPA: glycerophosphoryl diester phosphodiesterase membrane domain-containing protein [Allosphingosinicella sp.]|jgi:hypothetical protein